MRHRSGLRPMTAGVCLLRAALAATATFGLLLAVFGSLGSPRGQAVLRRLEWLAPVRGRWLRLLAEFLLILLLCLEGITASFYGVLWLLEPLPLFPLTPSL
jgi:hypothetical protein